jgi:hypothetical protein
MVISSINMNGRAAKVATDISTMIGRKKDPELLGATKKMKRLQKREASNFTLKDIYIYIN